MTRPETRPAVFVLGAASILVCLAIGSPAYAQDPAQSQRTTLGLVHLSINQVARLTFHLPPPERAAPAGVDSESAPVAVQLRFVDRDGNVLLNSDGNPIHPPAPASVQRGEVVSLDLLGFDLAGAGSGPVGIRAEVEILDATARGFASLELSDTVTGRRFVLYNRRWAWYVGGGIFAEPVLTGCFGAVRILSGETARLAVTLEDPLRDPGGEVGLVLRVGGSFILARDVVVLSEATPSGSVHFTAPHPDLDGVYGCVRITHGATAEGLLATLEVFDRDGNTVTMLEWSPPTMGGTGGQNGGGGAGGVTK